VSLRDREKSDRRNPFALLHDEERSISAVLIDINYSVRLPEIASMQMEDEFVFITSYRYPLWGEGWVNQRAIDSGVVIEEPIRLDPFTVRDAFVEVKSEAEALRFLTNVGPFWHAGSYLTWKQFQEWQEFVDLIRQDDFIKKVSEDKRAEEAMLALTGRSIKFFCAPDIAEPAPEPKPPKSKLERMMMERVLRDFERSGDVGVSITRKELEREGLPKWFLKPPDHAFTIEWHVPKAEDNLSVRSAKRELLPELSVAEFGLAPFLRIEVRTVLEAIAATVFVDRCAGVRYVKCEFCGRVFKRESEHGQKYCRRVLPDGSVLESCRNAAAQRAWRTRDREKREKQRLDEEMERAEAAEGRSNNRKAAKAVKTTKGKVNGNVTVQAR
jgi:Family of unknown function (DUF6076)